MDNKKYWQFKNKSAKEADLYLYIEIASWGAGFAAHSAQSFKEELDGLGELETLNIFINCPGGDVFEGVAIYNMLKRKQCTRNVYIDGIAASIASVIAMAGDNIYMPANAMMMVHNVLIGVFGFAEELRKAADTADQVTQSIKQTYLEKAGDKMDETTMTDLMDAESWLTAQDCLHYGLCTEITQSVQAVALLDAKFKDLYKNLPIELIKPDENANGDSVRISAIENAIKETDLFIALG